MCDTEDQQGDVHSRGVTWGRKEDMTKQVPEVSVQGRGSRSEENVKSQV